MRVGVISPMPRSLRDFINYRHYRDESWKEHKIINDEGIWTYCNNGWMWIPGRTPYLSAKYMSKIGISIFKNYSWENGMPDILHAHNAVFAGFIAVKIAEEYKLPFVITEHSSAHITNRIKPWEDKLIRQTYRKARRIICVSSFLCQELERRYPEINNIIECVPNILDTDFERIDIDDINRNHSHGGVRIISIGNLVDGKNFEGLIRAFADSFKGQNVYLRIGGDGPKRRSLEELTNVLGIRNQVEFLGYLNRNNVLREMLECDIFVLNSYYETFGVVIIEALACGKPVIATDCGGPRDIINNVNGILVPPGSNNKMAEAMRKMVSELKLYDPIEIKRDCVNRFGERRVVGMLNRIYEDILSKNRD
ncbi:MAG: glycosyltransferase [Actinobacteria bacterium]|nr:glycosyltransferase [Actinomycetota bacterium]